MTPDVDTSDDAFLDGRLRIRQPVQGYRASTDPVFLASATPARPGETVLDLGGGTGVASLCLGWRVPDLSLTAIERQPQLAELARENAALNGIELEVVTGDVGRMPPVLTRRSFDHVITNPPYFEAGSGTAPQDPGRKAATGESMALTTWLDAGFRRLRHGGYLTLIHRAERLGAVVSALADRAGDMRVLPICSRVGKPAGRILVRCRKGARTPDRLLPPLIVHEGKEHVEDRDSHTVAASRILRDGDAIEI